MKIHHVVIITLISTAFIVSYRYSTSSKSSLPKHVEKEENNNYKNFNDSNKTPSTINPSNITNKSILYWDTFHGDTTMGLGLGQEIFSSCQFTNCFTTKNRNILPIEDYDAVLFHGARYKIKQDGQPKRRSTKQKYIFYSWESVFNSYLDLKTNNDYYNWTMSFKRNSDVYYPYGVVVKQNSNYSLPSNDFLKGKTKLVAWFASNCYTEGGKKRKMFVQRLQKHIPVDIYGACGVLKCPRSEECYKMLEKNYKFYLSYENSFCPGYVTEKLFNILNYNVVPVVMGGADYSVIAPPNSVINANQFTNESLLAAFLNELDLNDTLYLEYFEWKKHYVVQSSNEFALCQLCKKLNEPVQYSNYADIKDWFSENCTKN